MKKITCILHLFIKRDCACTDRKTQQTKLYSYNLLKRSVRIAEENTEHTILSTQNGLTVESAQR